MGEGSPGMEWKSLEEVSGNETSNSPEEEKSPEVKREVANLLEAMITTEPGRELLSTLNDLAETQLGENDWRGMDIGISLDQMGYTSEDAMKISSEVSDNLREND